MSNSLANETELIVDYVTPTADEAELARAGASPLAKTLRERPTELTIQVAGPGKNGDLRVAIPAAVGKMVLAILEELGQGNGVAVSTRGAEVTTTQAAEVLNVSRPFVVNLIDEGRIPSRLVGSHRRVLLKDVIAYRRAQKVKSREALDNLTAESQELGLYD